MARMRGTGSNLIQMYIQDQFMRQRQAEQEQMITDRQREMDAANFAQSILPKLRTGELRPDMLSDPIRQRAGQFINLDKASLSPDEILGQVAGDLGKLKEFGAVPSDPEIRGSLAGRGIKLGPTDPLPELITQALGGARDRTGKLEPLKELSFVSEQGIPQKQFVNQSEAPSYGAMPQERTAEQEGRRQATIATEGPLSPDVTNAKVKQENMLNQGTAASSAMKAGMEAGARTRSTLKEELKPDVLAAKFEQAKKIADMESLLRKDKAALKAKKDMHDQLGSVLIIGNRAAELSDKVNSSADVNIIQRAISGAGAMLGLDPDAAELNDIANAGALGLAGFLGNKGQVTEADKQAGLAFFPTAGIGHERAARRIANFRDLIEVAPFLNASPDVPMAEKLARAKEMIKQRRAMKKDPTPVDDDESIPGTGAQPNPAKPFSIINPGQ